MMVMESAQHQFPVGLRVLVVDDDPPCLFILEKMLQRCFYNVTTCGQAAIALAMLMQNKQRFDLVISDVHMPDMDGFKLLELIGLEMNIPVIMMSVDGEFSVVLKGVIHGACDYLLKPVRIEVLRNIWQHVVRKKQCKSREVEHVDNMADIERLKHGSENLEYTNSTKRKDFNDNDLDTEDQCTLKKQRVVWSIQLHQQFVSAVNHLGIDKAVPKRILDIMNVQGLTRENVASHLQKYRLYLKRLSFEKNHELHSQYPEFKGPFSNPPFWIGPGEFLMPAKCNQLSPETLTAAHSGFANSLSFPNNSGSVRVDPPGYVQISAVTEKSMQLRRSVDADTKPYRLNQDTPFEDIMALRQVGLAMDDVAEAYVSKSQLFSNGFAPTPIMGAITVSESPNPNLSEPIQTMATIRASPAPNSSLNDLITDFSQQLNQQHQRYSLQPARERFDVPIKCSVTSAESRFKRLSPPFSGASKDSLCQHVNPLGTVFGGQLTETSSKVLSIPIISTGRENFDLPSHTSMKTTGITKFEDNYFIDVKCSFDLLNPTASVSPSHLRTLSSGLQSRTDAQKSKLAMKLRADISANTKQYAGQNMKVDWQTQAPSLWQGTDRSPLSGPFVCSTKISNERHAVPCTIHNPEIVQGLDGLGSDLPKKKDGRISVHQGKVQDDWEHSTAHANMKSKEGRQGFASGIKGKTESGNILLAPFLSDDLLSILLKENKCLQQQKPVFSEHEVTMDGFPQGSLYVN